MPKASLWENLLCCIFCQIEAFLRRIAVAIGRKNNDEMAKKTHKKTEG